MKYFLSLLLIFNTYAQENLPVENEFVNFNKIQKVLKKDGLETAAKEKAKQAKKKQVDVDAQKKAFYNTPAGKDFWHIMTQYWLVKNVGVLKWDFHKPDFGVREYYAKFLKEVGYFGIKFDILYLNSPNVTHFGFPLSTNHYLFVISVPFIRAMDLSKLQISLLLFEDLLRLEDQQFIKKFDDETLLKLMNSNFYKKEFPKEEFHKVLTRFSDVVFNSGFTFKDQFKTTKKMDTILKNNPKYWKNYYHLLEKIDSLTKGNLLYKNYSKIYPAPELQLNWINPTTN
ncbi:hypothetical protein [Halobacteriovorax sp. ZH5_bin.2]|uniref:hypothetical protein n=1 Tax=Halobacteriovorax sp. ZH5_bin.2 TaxID=3157727 RepID=UPI0037243C5A